MVKIIVKTIMTPQSNHATNLASSSNQNAAPSGSNLFIGRLGRLGLLYGIFYVTAFLIVFAILAGTILAISKSFPSDSIQAAILGLAIFLVRTSWAVLTLLIVLSLGIRRLHDINQPGALILILLVPVVDVIFLLILLLLPGSREQNKYGTPVNSFSPLEVLGFKNAQQKV